MIRDGFRDFVDILGKALVGSLDTCHHPDEGQIFTTTHKHMSVVIETLLILRLNIATI